MQGPDGAGDLRRRGVALRARAEARVAERPARTTVSDGRIKRRTAPTLDSVQARIGAHLPVRMLTASAPSVARRGTLAAALVPRDPLPAGDVLAYEGSQDDELEQDLVGKTVDGRYQVMELIGAGGMGKNALMLYVAHRVDESYPGGQLYAELRAIGPWSRTARSTAAAEPGTRRTTAGGRSARRVVRGWSLTRG